MHRSPELIKCPCCAWQLIEQPSCRPQKEKSFDEVDMVLKYYRANEELKNKYEILTNKSLTMVGIGQGLVSQIEYCDDKKEGDWTGWTMNHRSVSTAFQHAEDWKQFYGRIMNDIIEQLGNESIPLQMIRKYVNDYKHFIHRRFERAVDCGKSTLDGERRCVHHVLSPFAYEFDHHHLDLESVAKIPQLVSDTVV